MITHSRRRFLQLAGLVGGGFALGFGCSGEQTHAPPAAPAPGAPGREAPEPAPLHEIDAYIGSMQAWAR